MAKDGRTGKKLAQTMGERSQERQKTSTRWCEKGGSRERRDKEGGKKKKKKKRIGRG
jgi:hypothetical protein